MKKNMKKVLLTALIILTVGTVGCGSKTDEDVTIIGGADGPTSIFLASKTEEITDDPALAIPGTWQADVVYIIMKPLEWIFLVVLYLVDVHPENRIAVQYMGKVPEYRH